MVLLISVLVVGLINGALDYFYSSKLSIPIGVLGGFLAYNAMIRNGLLPVSWTLG
jgi:hypothetical protein